MGQKIHPSGLRLGITQEHRSKWFATSKTYPILLQEDYKRFGVKESEVDFLIDVIRLVKESNVALLVKEQIDGTFKGSLRSRNDIDVQLVASEFGGGGHKAASGFSSSESFEKIKLRVKKSIESQF